MHLWTVNSCSCTCFWSTRSRKVNINHSLSLPQFQEAQKSLEARWNPGDEQRDITQQWLSRVLSHSFHGPFLQFRWSNFGFWTLGICGEMSNIFFFKLVLFVSTALHKYTSNYCLLFLLQLLPSSWHASLSPNSTSSAISVLFSVVLVQCPLFSWCFGC